MVYRHQRHLLRLASVLVSVPPRPAALAALATALAALAAAALALAAAALAFAAAAFTAEHLLRRHLRPLHRRSERPELHPLAQLSVELRRLPGVLRHADRARHWEAPDSDLL
jgi:ABC-type transporter Mla subunit MlaD